MRLIKRQKRIMHWQMELFDTVKYRNLLPGRNYTLHGMIVEKETGNPVSEERTLEFVPEKSEGSVELGFEISADELCQILRIHFNLSPQPAAAE